MKIQKLLLMYLKLKYTHLNNKDMKVHSSHMGKLMRLCIVIDMVILTVLFLESQMFPERREKSIQNHTKHSGLIT